MSPVCVCSSLAPRAARAGCRRRLAREKTDPSTWDLTKKSQRERQLQLLLEQMRRGNIRTELTRCLGCMCQDAYSLLPYDCNKGTSITENWYKILQDALRCVLFCSVTIENLCTAGVTRPVRLAFTVYSLKYATVSIRTSV